MSYTTEQKEQVFNHLAAVRDWRSPYKLVKELWGGDIKKEADIRKLLNELSREDRIVGDHLRPGHQETLVYAIVAEDIWTLTRGVVKYDGIDWSEEEKEEEDEQLEEVLK